MNNRLIITVKDGRPYHDKFELTHNTKLAIGPNHALVYHSNNGWQRVTCLTNDNKRVDRGVHDLVDNGSYNFTVGQSGERQYLRCWFEVPMELEIDPIKKILRQHNKGSLISKIRHLRDDQPMTFEMSPNTDVKSLERGMRALSFITDGTQLCPEGLNQDDNLPITGKVMNSTFVIQYSTWVNARGHVDVWIDNIQMRANRQAVRPVVFEKALMKVLDTSKRAEVMVTEGTAPPEPGLATTLGAALSAVGV